MFANIKKKSNKQFRKKVADEETSDKQPDQVATSTASTNDTPVTSEVKQTEEDDEFEKKVKERAEKKKKIETTRKPTKSTALSFGDDEVCIFMNTYLKNRNLKTIQRTFASPQVPLLLLKGNRRRNHAHYKMQIFQQLDSMLFETLPIITLPRI